MPNKNNDGFENIGVDKLAALFDVTARTIQNLFKHSGAEGKVGRGKYDLNVFSPWYANFIRAGQPSDDKVTAQDRKENAIATIKELEVLEIQKRVMPYELNEQIIVEEIRLIKENMYGIPNKVAVKMLKAHTKEETKAILTKEIDNAFRKYSNIPIKSISNTKRNTRKAAAPVKKAVTRKRATKGNIKNKRVGKKV